MASVDAISVPVIIKVEAVENSPQLQELLRALIREELANLSPESVEVLTTQIIKQYEVRERWQTASQ